ncbi:extracellular solute-binding protein [Paenibacillus provencensis]|uniref:Extracellular solute-binding protein n=1 Tax=Paenibacillus provencensis TaxID=441151 RepID=A0ABW3PMT8_9BACL|nr:extracellular solute-binding protein [Paenibacillus sp. MER 78]MCM3127456.1 extracellular solute-binding protein [Paenibacillus sp. MER 78]
MKKFLSLMLTAVMTTGLLAGCGGSESADGPAPEEGEQAITEIPLPIVDEPMTINYWRANDAKIASGNGFSDVKAYQEKEKRTGIKVNFTHPPLGQQKDQFNLLVTGNELPDVIYYNWADVSGGPEKLLADGRIIKLNEYIDLYAPNLKKIIEEDEVVRKQISLDDGTIFMFPYLRTDAVKLNATTGIVLRKDWLEKLNLNTPATIDEWYTVLKAFREEDPNGNGKKDELPFTANWGPGNMSKLYDFAPSFGVIGGFQLNGDTVEYGPIQPGFKDFLETMQKWYAEGLIDPEIMTNDGKAFDYKITNHQAGAYYGGVFSGMAKYLNLMADDPEFDLVGAPWPKDSEGISRSTFRFDTKVLTYGEAITTSADEDKIKAIVQWMDYNYSPEGHDLFNFGIEGESYTVDGDSIKFTDTILNNPDGLTYDQALAGYALSIMDGPMNQDTRYLDGLMAFEQQQEANKVWMEADYSLALPTLRKTEEEARKEAQIMGQITTYLDEMMTKFILGDEPLTNFDQYVETIKGMGIEEVIKINQDAYERYQAR